MSEKAKILLAEHDMPVAMWMISILTRAGYDVEPVFTGHKALAIGKERKFDLIILDTELPGINGYEICRELKQRHISWKTPVVFVSANSDIENQQHALEIGAVDFIEKPFNEDEFTTRIFSAFSQTTVA